MSFNKILFICLLLLAVIIFGELGYYLMIKKTAADRTGNTALSVSPSIKQPAPTSKPPINLSPTINSSDIAVSSETLRYLSTLFHGYRKGILSSSLLTNTLEGKVINTSKDEWVSPDKKVYKASIRLGAKNNLKNTIFFSQQELDNLQIFDIPKNGTSRKPLNFSEIAKGDYVIMKQTIDLLQNNFLKGIKSTILEVYKP